MSKIVEAFAGIVAQRAAIPDNRFEISSIIEWNVHSIIAYFVYHHDPKQNVSDWLEQSLPKDKPAQKELHQRLYTELQAYQLSMNGKTPMTRNQLKRLSLKRLFLLNKAIEDHGNLVDITKADANSLDESDIFTYSFPCQDLSNAGQFANNNMGINKSQGNRSSLLWETERLLQELSKRPSYLIAENVVQLYLPKYADDLADYLKTLKRFGYETYKLRMDARDFGIPQARERAFLLSVHNKMPGLEATQLTSIIERYFEKKRDIYVLNNPSQQLIKDLKIADILQDSTNQEAKASVPNHTVSRYGIYRHNLKLSKEGPGSSYIHTISTKQDRQPNSGVVTLREPTPLEQKLLNLLEKSKGFKITSDQKQFFEQHQSEFEQLTKDNPLFRYLTPRECFLLMDFEAGRVDQLIAFSKANPDILSPTELYKIAGNSIVVSMLKQIFEIINVIDQEAKDATK